MEKRKLGLLTVPPIAFGSNVFGWTVGEKTAFSLLDQLLANGLNFIDTADIYSNWGAGNKGGESETIIGNWLKARGGRERLIIATKVGMPMSATKKGLSEKYILQAVEDSLRRLQTDYIDLYQSHQDDETVPLAETLGAYDQLIKAGKVRVIGASNFSAARLKASLTTSEKNELPLYKSLQPHYNLYQRQDFETQLQPFCLEHHLGVIPYFSLASGFLTGKYRSEKDFSKSIRGSSMGKFLNARGFKILAALDEVAAKHIASNAQVALAWLMARPAVVAPIASATSAEQLNELIGATRLKLDKNDLNLLDTASAY